MTSGVSKPRTAKRVRVLKSGSLLTSEGLCNVLIRDLSADGALIYADSEIPENCDAIFKKGEMFAAVRVAWSDGRNAGIRFYRPLSVAEVSSLSVARPGKVSPMTASVASGPVAVPRTQRSGGSEARVQGEAGGA